MIQLKIKVCSLFYPLSAVSNPQFSFNNKNRALPFYFHRDNNDHSSIFRVSHGSPFGFYMNSLGMSPRKVKQNHYSGRAISSNNKPWVLEPGK